MPPQRLIPSDKHYLRQGLKSPEAGLVYSYAIVKTSSNPFPERHAKYLALKSLLPEGRLCPQHFPTFLITENKCRT